jgi:Protein of unknown function, DUF547
MMKGFLKVLPLIALLLQISNLAAAEFDPSHKSLDAVLKQYVKNGRVHYSELKGHRQALDTYLDQVASVPEAEFKQWNEQQQLAFLINVYNAFTLRLIVDHYPVKSIKDTGTLLHGPWEQPIVQLFGTTTTLDFIEHTLLRKNYNEPRIHLAIVCAAKSCPPLRNEAYQAGRLEEQLNDQGREFLADPSKNRVDLAGRVVYLSPIFKWYAGDFDKKSGSVLNFLKPFWSASVRKELDKAEFKVRFTEYDWSLNEASQSASALTQ